MPYNFLLPSWGSPGHLGPMLTAAQQLRSRGHGVRFIAREDARAPVEAAGYSFTAWRRTPSFTPIAPHGEGIAPRLTISFSLVPPPPVQPTRGTKSIVRQPTLCFRISVWSALLWPRKPQAYRAHC